MRVYSLVVISFGIIAVGFTVVQGFVVSQQSSASAVSFVVPSTMAVHRPRRRLPASSTVLRESDFPHDHHQQHHQQHQHDDDDENETVVGVAQQKSVFDPLAESSEEVLPPREQEEHLLVASAMTDHDENSNHNKEGLNIWAARGLLLFVAALWGTNFAVRCFGKYTRIRDDDVPSCLIYTALACFGLDWIGLYTLMCLILFVV